MSTNGMSSDGPTPSPCNPEIFSKGQGVCTAYAPSNAMENWVRMIAEKADAQVDWHYSGGIANVLHLGDGESRQRVLNAIHEHKDELKNGNVMSIGGPALYRRGVNDPEAIGAVVEKVDGQVVLRDSTAEAVATAVEKLNCEQTFALNADRVAHFKNRLSEKGMGPDEAIIVVINVDDPNGSQLAEVLMPGTDWQEFRDRGEIPFARGLAMREGIQEALGLFDTSAAEKLKGMGGVPVVVVDHGVAEVFAA